MTTPNLKLIALNTLRQLTVPTKLTDLLAMLGDSYSERSLRRWLAEWVAAGLVIKTGKKRGTHYLAVDQQYEKVHSLFSEPSLHTIQKIKKPYSLREPVSYNEVWLTEYRPNIDSYLSDHITEVLSKIGTRSSTEKPAGTYARQIYQRLLIDLSYNSSRLEGNTYSLLQTKELIINGIDVPGKLDEEKTMILNHKEAIRYMIEQPNKLMISETTILTLHYLLSDSLVAPQYSGKVRDDGVRINGSVYIPLENSIHLNRILKKICDKAELIHNPYEQSIFLLIHLAYLQAFVDVNKRTSRLAANIPLINHNLVPLAFNDVDQEDYTSAMIAVYELNDVRPLVDLYLYSYNRTCQIYNVTVESIGFDRIRVQYRLQRRELIRDIILNKLKGKLLEKHIALVVSQFANPEDRDHVIENVRDDLKLLGPETIVGLGVSIADLEAWLIAK